jgi:hypothetical protein
VVLVFESSRSLISGLLALDLPKPVRYAAVPADRNLDVRPVDLRVRPPQLNDLPLKRLSGWASMIPHAATQFGSVGPPDFNSVKTIAHPRGGLTCRTNSFNVAWTALISVFLRLIFQPSGMKRTLACQAPRYVAALRAALAPRSPDSSSPRRCRKDRGTIPPEGITLR